MRMQLKAWGIVVCMLFLTFGLFAQNNKQEQLEQQRRNLLNKIAQINKLRQSNKKKEINILSEVEDLDQRIRAREDLIKVTNRQANLLTREINDNITKITNLRDELKQLKEDYAKMIQKSYKSNSSQSRIMFLLSSETFLQAFKRIKYMKQYSNYRKQQGEQIKERTTLLQETNKKLVQQKADKEELIAQNKKDKARLSQEKQQQDALMAQVRKKEDAYAAQIRENQRRADAIDREIKRIIREAIAASNKAAGKEPSKNKADLKFNLTPEAKALANDFAANKGKLPWPVKTGRVYKSFGRTQHPTLRNISTYNSGVEIQTDPGSMARAAFKGIVFKIQGLPGANKAVYIRHGNYITVYQNLRNLKVRVNQEVSAKQELGEIAENSFSGKTILKFLVSKDAELQNPASWVYNM